MGINIVFAISLLALFKLGETQVNSPWSTWTPLDEYVNAADSYYTYQRVAEYRHSQSTVYIINMTSQQWMDETVTTRSIWWHWLYLAIPDNIVHYDAAFLYIHSGNNRNADSVPGPTDGRVRDSAAYAESMNAPAGYLRQIPNQPMTFLDDEDELETTEDATIAYTWRKWVEDNSTEPKFLLRFPMTKAVMRAFDTITHFTASLNPRFNITKFVPGGESKRGWTTWLVGCADRRVVGMVPMVLSVLNLQTVLHKQWRTMGGWTFAFGNYYVEGMTRYLDHPRTQLMADHVDPFSYRDRMRMPKMLLSGASDEFFQIDDTNYFWDDLPGTKFLMNLPNTGHSLTPQRPAVNANLASFFRSVILEHPWPQFSWTRQANNDTRVGTITVTSRTLPMEVTAWFARTTNLTEDRRDFRQRIVDFEELGVRDNPVRWIEEPVVDRGNGIYVKEYLYPSEGFLAFFLQMRYTTPTSDVLQFTTTPLILPDMFPYPPCQGEGCMGFVM